MSLELVLSRIRPDWQDLVDQLQRDLIKRDAWKDYIESSTGQTLVELLAAIGALDQYSIESATQEAFPSTAKNTSSIYAIAQMLGVRLNRKTPAAITANISAPANVTLPAFTQFTGGGSFFFNRTAINVTPVPTAVTLYQGKVQTFAVQGSGSDFQAFVVQEKDFAVSDSDIIVLKNNISLNISRAGLWQFKGVDGVQDLTLPDGRAMILFGSDQYGAKPSITDLINITYAVTAGADGNNLVTDTKKLLCDTDDTIVTTATSNPTGGANESPPIVYKSIAAQTFGSFSSAVTRTQHDAQLFTYPGVLDGITFAQRLINPRSLRWMNLIKVVLLTSSVWNTTQKNAFLTFMQDSAMYSPRFFLEDPQAVPVNIDVEVFCSNNANLSQIKNDVEASMALLFAAKPKVLNRNIYRSDIIDAIFKTNSLIEYVILNTPSTDTYIERASIETPIATQLTGAPLAKVWQVDATPGPDAFVDQTTNANNATVNDVILFPATENVNDYVAFGMDDKFGKLTFNYATGTAGAGGTVAWEYWNGASWAALSGVSDGTTGFTTAAADGLNVTWTVPANWAKTSLNGSSLYYVRARVTGTYATNPQMTQVFVGGTLTVGQTYEYGIGYTLSGGEIAPTNWVTVTLDSGKQSINLAWTSVPNVTNYRIWGRQTINATPGLLASLPSTQLSFLDNGAATVVPPLIDQDTIPIRYGTLGTLNVVTKFSTRLKG